MQVSDVGPTPIAYTSKPGNIFISIDLQGVPYDFPILCRIVSVPPGSADATDLRGYSPDAVLSVSSSSERERSVGCQLPPVKQSSALSVSGYDLFLSANGYNWLYTGRLGLVPPPVVAVVRPSIGPVGRKLPIFVSGSAFLKTTRLQCIFSVLNGTSYIQVYSDRAEYANSSFLQCMTPRAAELNLSSLFEIRSAFAAGALLRLQVDVSLNGRDPGLAQDLLGQNIFYGFGEPAVFAVIPREAAIKDSANAVPVFTAFNISLFGVNLGYSGTQILPRFWARLTFPPFCADSSYTPTTACWQRISSVLTGGFNRTKAIVRIAEAPTLTPGSERRARLGLEFSIDGGSTVSRIEQALTIYYTTGTVPISYPGLPGGGLPPSCRSNGGICGAGICGSVLTLATDICLCFHAQVCCNL